MSKSLEKNKQQELKKKKGRKEGRCTFFAPNPLAILTTIHSLTLRGTEGVLEKGIKRMKKTTRKVDDQESPRTTCENVSPSKKIRFDVPKVTVSDFAELEELHRKCQTGK